jgi:ribosomal protein S18 acetylase RimI-like enzyme
MKFEKLDIKKHSAYKVAELIYETDHDIFNFFYHNKSKTAEILEKLIVMGGNNLGHENICVVTQDDSVIGVLLYSMGDHHAFHELMFHFKNLSFIDALKFSLIDLKDNMVLAHLDEGDFYLAGVAVDEDFRGQGIGSLILDHGIGMAKKRGFRRVVLDVALDNPGAKRLYEKTGFRVFNERSYPWVSGRIGMYNMEITIK